MQAWLVLIAVNVKTVDHLLLHIYAATGQSWKPVVCGSVSQRHVMRTEVVDGIGVGDVGVFLSPTFFAAERNLTLDHPLPLWSIHLRPALLRPAGDCLLVNTRWDLFQKSQVLKLQLHHHNKNPDFRITCARP